MRTLDRIDAEILRCLQNDGRMSNKELAGKVGLAPSSCLERVRRLQEQGVLRGYRADVAPQALGIGLQAMVAVRLRSHEQSAWAEVSERLNARREVVAVYHVAGADDLLVHVACRDAEHLRDVVMDGVSAIRHVGHVETSLIFDHRASALPVYVGD